MTVDAQTSAIFILAGGNRAVPHTCSLTDMKTLAENEGVVSESDLAQLKVASICQPQHRMETIEATAFLGRRADTA
ncbi:hypothetical protein [Paraburkholderia lacunae]|uniref:hypothetical protein n=1 Tax=Paraburkholderia lacunae TaxID=2211104 RepID=UPI001AD837FE|nr:hypothetical protein [Paraburkholderia lacunae]